MALASSSLLLSLLISFLLLSTSVTARPGRPFHPCNTLLISTYSVSFGSGNPNFPNNPDLTLHRPEFFAVVAEVRAFHPNPDSIMIDGADPSFLLGEQDRIHRPGLPVGAGSLRDRTVDILNVVASLLFGAACGALTAGTMYLVWSLFSNRGDDAYHSLEGFTDDDDNDDDIFNPKKPVNVYVAVPAAPPPVAVESATADVPAMESA